MSENHASVAGRLLVCATLLALLLAAPPAAAGPTATLTVRVKVVEDCQVTLPDRIPPHARRHLPDHLLRLIDHRCRGPVRPRISVGPSLRPFPPPGQRFLEIARELRPGGRVLVTISY